jgi:hypothetical protein
MAIDRKELIELYKATLEEKRHHDRTIMQIFIALIVGISIFIAAIASLFSGDSSLHFVVGAKVGVVAIFVLVEIFFLFAFKRIDARFRTCDKVRREVEKRLLNNVNAAKISEFSGILIGQELDKIDEQSAYIKHKFIAYILLSLVALTALILLLLYL